MTVAEFTGFVDEQYHNKVKALIGLNAKTKNGLSLKTVSYVALNGQECVLLEFETSGEVIRGHSMQKLQDTMPHVLSKVPLTHNVKVTIDDEPAMWMDYSNKEVEDHKAVLLHIATLADLQEDGLPGDFLVKLFMEDGSPVSTFQSFMDKFKEIENGKQSQD